MFRYVTGAAPDLDSYAAISGLIVLGIGAFAEPQESKRQKILYWIIAPLLVSVFMTIGFRSILSGLGCGAGALLFLWLGYLRFHLFS